jgi:hypothetical protein
MSYWLKEKHEKLIIEFQEHFELTDYQMWWACFAEGVLVGLILAWIF